MRVSFHYDIEKFRLRESRIIKKILNRIVSDARLRTGIIDIIMTTDEKLHGINKEFLGHDYYTDVIAFNYNKGNTVNGEIYISVDRVRQNSKELNVTFRSEIRRVIFHGLLHLCGYDDRDDGGKKMMSEMEEIYLALSYAE